MITILASTSSATTSIFPKLIAVAFTVLGTLFTTFGVIELAREVRSPRKAAFQKTLEDRLEELSKSMRNSAKLVEQVSAELDTRAAIARKLKEEAETAEALAAINKEQAEAIRRLMDAELEGAARRIRRDSIVIGIASFIAGGGVSFLITLLVHPLH